ncbi:hypothetical protein IEQ34_004724 [Dendrobium chrysotoxum]|uniref:Uncharacterized protein n=1 Tax=Dendrobium chrysotoxum TaxID=161865 RepID=A0AAV7HEQ7_DENCH|nr:hypothetical protein IEQ34_004724 [Dendrobium chrysotoxum]
MTFNPQKCSRNLSIKKYVGASVKTLPPSFWETLLPQVFKTFWMPKVKDLKSKLNGNDKC